jgi:Phasin protein
VANPSVTFPTPEFKFPAFDLDTLFATQKANLAAVHEAQSVLTGAAQAIAKVQYGYVEQAVAEAKAALATKDLPKPEAVLANVKAGVEKAVAVAKEVVDLAVGAQKRVYEVLTQRSQASVEELKAVTA